MVKKLWNELAKKAARNTSVPSQIVHGTIIVIVIVFLGGILSIFAENAEATRHDKNQQITLPLAIPFLPQNQDISSATASNQTQMSSISAPDNPDWKTLKVKRGDNLSTILGSIGIDGTQIHSLMQTDRSTKMLTRIIPGEQLEVKLQQKGLIDTLIYRVDEQTSVVYQREAGDVFSVRVDTKELERRVALVSGAITSSLFEAALAADLPESVALEMANIFGWDIDFALDIREGDAFTVMYEEFYLDSKKVRDGAILAAEFVNQSVAYKAVRYTDASGNTGYFTPDGKSMRKAFLRMPVDFTRISSRFGNRLHPTLNRQMQHQGVDYAAPRGTPVKVSGDGRIIFRGYKGGYGKVVIVEHGSGYRTLYAHLNDFSSKARFNQSVKQGQIIGYVGSTGRATGPHLHYEFQVNGVHRNPLTIKLPDANPISARYRDDYLDYSRKLLAQIATARTTLGLSAI